MDINHLINSEVDWVSMAKRWIKAEHAEDVVQQSFIRAYKWQLKGGEEPSHLTNWFITIIRNQCREYWRTLDRRKEYSFWPDEVMEQDTQSAMTAPLSDQPDWQLECRQESEWQLSWLHHHIDNLPPKSREAVKYFIATGAYTGTNSTFRVRVHRALIELNAQARKQNLTSRPRSAIPNLRKG